MNGEWYEWAYNTKKYLHNVQLIHKQYFGDPNDHVHCEICWAKISSQAKDLHDGYYDKQSKSWICDDCFNLLKDLFGWQETSN